MNAGGDLLDLSVRVRVPATSANLGPGFDTLGLALALHDEVTARVEPTGVVIEVTGEGASEVPRDESHLVLRAMRRTFADLSVAPAGLWLSCRNTIPHARGLGSSAAAIVAGIVLARGLVRDGDERMSRTDVLALAAELEGHADNVAACLLGGLTVAWSEGESEGEFEREPERQRARAVRRDLHPDVSPVVFVPPTTASTSVARGMLPAAVPHRDAAFTAARAALLVTALTAEPHLLFPATEDRLHQSYRAPAAPAGAALMAQLRASGHAAVVSGAGPTVLVLARSEREVEQVSAAAPEGWRVLPLRPDLAGAQLERSVGDGI
jgi:homoserine kinase